MPTPVVLKTHPLIPQQRINQCVNVICQNDPGRRTAPSLIRRVTASYDAIFQLDTASLELNAKLATGELVAMF